MEITCEVCGAAIASVHLTNLVRGHVEQEHLCEQCATDKGVARPRTAGLVARLVSGTVETRCAGIKRHFDEGGTSAELVESWVASPDAAGFAFGEDVKRKMIAELTQQYERMKKHFANGGTLAEFAKQESRREKEEVVKHFDEARRHFEGGGTTQELVAQWRSRHECIVPPTTEILSELAERLQQHFEQGGSAKELVDKEYGNLFL